MAFLLIVFERFGKSFTTNNRFFELSEMDSLSTPYCNLPINEEWRYSLNSDEIEAIGPF